MLLQLRAPPRTAVLWVLSAASTAGAWAASLAVVRRLGAQQLWDAEAQGMIAGALARGGRWAAGLRFLASGASPARGCAASVLSATASAGAWAAAHAAWTNVGGVEAFLRDEGR